MAHTVDPDRLKQLRRIKDLSQAALAAEARVTKQTIYRLERGQQRRIRKNTIDRLCDALGIDAETLGGLKPLAPPERRPEEALAETRYQLNVRLDGAVRNAFSLAALRYKIPVARIVELAPFLFVLAAERSLDRRRKKLSELLSLFDREDELRSSFGHLPISIAPNYEANDSVAEEQRSIDARDILGARISDDIFRVGPVREDFVFGKHNPFVIYLREASEGEPNLAEITRFDAGFAPNYHICPDEALAMAGGDEDLANGIVAGLVQLHEIPRELLKDEATVARVQWMRPKIEAAREAARKNDEEIGAEMARLVEEDAERASNTIDAISRGDRSLENGGAS